MRTLSLLALAGAAQLAAAAPAADLVTSLPNFGPPPTTTYSGYLNAGNGKYLHYVYTKSLSNATNVPLVAWYNGGPGCSSLEGLLSEGGLFHVQEFSDPPTLAINPFSWSLYVDMLYIESPAGVGFSYCTSRSGCDHTDTSTAKDSLASLQDFFTNKFPEFQSRDFWISGESYAGIYVPSLAFEVYNYNSGAPSTPINLKGILVGNGCIGNAAGHCADRDPTGLSNYHDIQQWRGHGLISETLYDDIMSACSSNWASPSLECDLFLAAASLGVADLDVYDLYNTCADPAAPAPPNPANATTTRISRAPYAENGMLARVNRIRLDQGKPALGLDPNCFGSGPTIEQWLNQANVKAALHVAPGIEFALCSNNFTFNYNGDIPDERTEIYPTLTQKAGYQVLVFNGEADLCVPFTDNEYWTRSMNYSVISPWQAWSVPGEEGPYVGGYRIHYANNFTFATVRGAGHMVPETRPEAALALLKNHIFGNKNW